MKRQFPGKILERLENRPYHPALPFFVVLIAGLGRTAEEIYWGHASLGLRVLSHYTAFYLATALGFTVIAAVLLREDWRKVSQAVVFGVLVGLLPPLIDVIWLGPGRFQYRYLDRFYPTLHGAGNPYSEVIAAWSALLLFAAYLWLKSRSFVRTLLGLALGYLYVVLTVAAYPGLGDRIFGFLQESTARGFVFLFLSYVFYVALNFRRFRPSLKRINHSLPWVVLVFLGAALTGGIQAMTWFQALIVLFVHQGAVFANDYYDRASDEVNQRKGLLERNDVLVIHGLILWLALQVCFTAPKIGYLYLFYVLLTAAYHHPLTRLKTVFPLNYLTEGTVAALSLLIGMASAGVFELGYAELLYLGLAFLGFAAASPFKDYKDIPGDSASGTRTLYVLLGERGWTAERTHVLVSSAVLIFAAAPLVWLYLKKVPILPVALLAAAFLVPIFLCLRQKKPTAAVERTAWLMTAYLIALVVALRWVPVAPESGPLQDFGRLSSGSAAYEASHPATTDEVAALVRKARASRARIRVRGNAHSMNGSSLPRDGELLVRTDRLRAYRFEEPGTVTVGAGMGMYELRAFLKARKYHLPVVNDGSGGPTVGGYIAAGGIGGQSRFYGGFWENVLEITLVTGTGDVLKIRPGDALFPWMFGSMGQLGIVTQAKLKIQNSEATYPLGESGEIPAVPVGGAERLYWFTLFVPAPELDAANELIRKIKQDHAETFNYKQDYVYPIKFFAFNPPLVFPAQRDFVGVGLWGYPATPGGSALMDVEKDVMEAVRAHREAPYRRYIQSEPVAPNTDYRDYFGAAVYDEFLAIKKRLDPDFLLDCGTVFACP
ncbi:MAG TPA: FAD-binding protein [bacterium]|nr:FAD-binding protein [bacterium]